MKVHYRKSMGSFYLIVGSIFIIYAVLSIGDGKYAITVLVFGIALLLLSIQLLLGCLFIVKERSLVINSIIGLPMNIYQFEAIKDLEIIDNMVYLFQDGQLKKLRISAWMANQKEWQAFVDRVNGLS